MANSEHPACLLSQISTDHPTEPYCLHVYNKDVVVKKSHPAPANAKRGNREKIFEFSASSRRRLLFVCRNSGNHIKSQFCLTYHDVWPDDGKEVKKHLNHFLTLLRRQFPGVHYLWVFEFQERGAPHIHLFSSLPPTEDNRMMLAHNWSRIVGGTESHLRFHCHKRNMIRWNMRSGKYLTKEYLAKSVQKGVPANFQNVGRFWGCSRNMKPEFQVVAPDDVLEFKKIVRTISKKYERTVASYKGKRVNFRRRVRSFTVPLASTAFFILANHYHWLANNLGELSYQTATGLQSWQLPF